MQKYRVFEPQVKTKWFSFFKAENTQSRDLVTIKKLHREATWEEIFKNKNISLMNNSKIKAIANIKQIVKDDSNFYCVFQNLENNLETVIRGELQKEDIFKISRSLIQMIIQLNEEKIIPRQIRPSALFVSNNYLSLKMAHIQAFANRDFSKLDLVELQDLRYSSPESVLTSKDIDERSMVFAAGLIISQLILGKPLLSSNTKINYIFELTKLFPEERLDQEQQMPSRLKQGSEEERFQNVLGVYNFSNEFIALIREMLKIDRNERIVIGELLEAFDLIVSNQENFIKENEQKTLIAQQSVKPNINQAPINKEIIQQQIDLDFQKKPTLSTQPTLKINTTVLPIEKNVDDDAVQPIIIKQSSKPFEFQGQSMPVSLLKDPAKMSRTTKQQTISTVKRPQLTNYALNEGNNLGVKLGFHPTLFSQNQNDF